LSPLSRKILRSTRKRYLWSKLFIASSDAA
jgi:hypothetical protein